MIQLLKYQQLVTMRTNYKSHYYILPDGQIVNTQLEGRLKLGIGRNAFRNMVKSLKIRKVILTDKPQGYYETEKKNYKETT